MKLRVHFIAKGCYIKAGEEIPDDEVPPALAKYAVTGDAENAQPLELKKTALAHASQAESKKALTFVCATMTLPADQKPYNSRP